MRDKEVPEAFLVREVLLEWQVSLEREESLEPQAQKVHLVKPAQKGLLVTRVLLD